ncbi:MAG TPA: response regulator [Polyangiales bacterium]|jgi:CheY-like chemotaxis protein|nr:response regulator [Polyangiales bacterium]
MADPSLQPRLIGASVLVVDDDSDVTDLLRASFERLGAMVTTAASVEEALATLMANEVDLIVSDIGMPNRDGYSLISAVRGAYIVNNLPAIAYTALCSPKERKQALKAGFTAHVCKQADLGVLLHTAENLLQSSGLHPSDAPRVFWG